MDFFDLAKLFLKWWFIVVPMVVLTLGVSLLLSDRVQPEFTASGSMILNGPSVSEQGDEVDGDDANVSNPLVSSGGLPTTAYVTALSVGSPQVASILADEGLATSYDVAAETRLPIIRFETRSGSREGATQTAIRLVELIEDDLSLRQEAAGVPAGERVTTEVIDIAAAGGGDYSGQNRFRIVVIALGLACTIAVVFLVESLSQRRRDRATDGENGDAPEHSAGELEHDDEPEHRTIELEHHDEPEHRAGEPEHSAIELEHDDEPAHGAGELERHDRSDVPGEDWSDVSGEHRNGDSAEHPAIPRVQRTTLSRTGPHRTERVRRTRER